MILIELYSVRSGIVEASMDSDDVKKSLTKLDNLINLVSNAPSSENNSNFPRTRLRRWNNQD